MSHFGGMDSAKLEQLEALLNVDVENQEFIKNCYECVIKYEYNADDPPQTIRIIIQSMKWLLEYERAFADELREIAEKEANEFNEKEDKLEKEARTLKNEITELRKLLASNTKNDVYKSETFRVDNLQEEIAYLNAQIRGRVREINDERDKNEELTARVNALEKERNSLIHHKSLLEDRIRDLNRHLSSTNEISAKIEADERKLNQRNEQIIKLSSHIKEITQRNDEMANEIDRLSQALASATVFIEDTTEKYASMRNELIESNKVIERLANENEILTKQIEVRGEAFKKMEYTEGATIECYQNIISGKDRQIEELQEATRSFQVELDKTRAQIQLNKSEEREEELERLRNELVEATKFAKQFFGSINAGRDRNIMELQSKILQLNQEILSAKKEIEAIMKEKNNLEKSLEMKDDENLKINNELKRMRIETFGDAENEISRLEKQLKFRDEQIEKLNVKCSLLHYELISPSEKANISFSGVLNLSHETIRSAEESSEDSTSLSPPKLKTTEDKSIETDVKNTVDTVQKALATEKTEIQTKILRPNTQTIESWEASAMLIASQNHELMILLQEIEDKDEQLQRMERIMIDATKNFDCLTEKYSKLQEEFIKFKEVKERELNRKINDTIAEYEVELEWYNKLSNSVEKGELTKATMHRKLISERIQRCRLDRKLRMIEKNYESEKDENINLKKKLQYNIMLHGKQLITARYEAELTTLELARLQNILLHSVPQREYDILLDKYKRILVEESGDIQPSQLRSSCNLQIELLQTDCKSNENELLAKIDYLKNLNDVLNNQNEFWKAENDKLIKENGELQKFFEEIECESHVKGMLVAIQRRFLKLLTEQADYNRSQTFSANQFHRLRSEFSTKSLQWVAERKKLIKIIRNLQISIQRLESNSVGIFTMDQIAQIKENSIKAKENLKKSDEKLKEVESKSEELAIQLRNIESIKWSHEKIKENDFDVIKLQKSFQANQFNLLNTINDLDNTKSQLKKKEEKIAELETYIEQLKIQISDLITADSDIISFNVDNAKALAEENIVSDITNPGDLEENAITTQQVPSATINSSEAEAEQKECLQTKMIIYDNSEKCEKKVEYIRETAQLCIENYKDQLKYKEEVIEKYKEIIKQMDNKKISEKNKGILLQRENDDEGKLTEKMKRSNEILENQKFDENFQQIYRLKMDIDELENANKRLSERLTEINETSQRNQQQQQVQQLKEYIDGSTQTINLDEIFNDEKIINENYQSPLSPSPSSFNKPSLSPSPFNKFDEQNNRIIDLNENQSLKIPQELNKLTKKKLQIKTNDGIRNENNILHALRKEESLVNSLRNEIRTLKERLATQTANNKELKEVCEKIREEALSTIEQKYYRTEFATGNMENNELFNKLEKTKTEVINLKRTVRIQNELIGKLQKEQKKFELKNSSEGVARWRQNKSYEANLNALQKKLKECESRESELQEIIKRREKRIEQMNREEKLRINELEKLEITLKDLRMNNDNFLSIKDESDKKIKMFEDSISLITQQNTLLRKENEILNGRLTNLQNELEDANEKLQRIREEKSQKIENLHKFSKSTEINGIEESLFQKNSRDYKEAYEEARERLLLVEKEYTKFRKEYNKIIKRITKKEFKEPEEISAIAVLRDKLMAKEKIIEQQNHRIEMLERERWRRIL